MGSVTVSTMEGEEEDEIEAVSVICSSLSSQQCFSAPESGSKRTLCIPD